MGLGHVWRKEKCVCRILSGDLKDGESWGYLGAEATYY